MCLRTVYWKNIFCLLVSVPVTGDRVKVSLLGRSLVHCELPVETWELLWELRTSIQTMLYRNLSNPSNAFTYSAQDGELISLLVELLNNTDSNSSVQNHSSDSETDWRRRALSKRVRWICWLEQRNQRASCFLICMNLFFQELSLCWMCWAVRDSWRAEKNAVYCCLMLLFLREMVNFKSCEVIHWFGFLDCGLSFMIICFLKAEVKFYSSE